MNNNYVSPGSLRYIDDGDGFRDDLWISLMPLVVSTENEPENPLMCNFHKLNGIFALLVHISTRQRTSSIDINLSILYYC